MVSTVRQAVEHISMTSLLHINNPDDVSDGDHDDWLYPSSDGNPMAENTIQYRWIVIIKENLEIIFVKTSDVFIAADLLWYPMPVQSPPAPAQAPDVMLVFWETQRRSCLLSAVERAKHPPSSCV